ncbi:MAG: DUF4038 domain-containing protein [Gemmatimonadetes bacterium]|nr:DUF4038 domain-containing protein [Gemmatimonadota bacterium]
MRARAAALLAVMAVCASPFGAPGAAHAQLPSVERHGVFEAALTHSGSVANPYRDLSATATFTRPGGGTRTIPLFWAGGTTWRVRFSPDVVGEWTWTTSSSNPGLNGISGAFQCVTSARRGGVQRMSGFPYHFARQDGTPFWWFGDTQWILYSDDASEGLDRTASLHYVDVRAAQGFNVILSALYVTRGNQAGFQFANVSQEVLNPAFWQEVDSRLAYVQGKGITAGLTLGWGDRFPDFPSDEARARFARYVAARYSAYDVFFIVANEYGDGLTEAQARMLGQALDDADPHGRMIGNHSTKKMSVEVFADDPWMSFGDFQQRYVTLHKLVLDSRDHAKPVVNAEYGYYLRDMTEPPNGVVDKNNSFTLADMRYATWDIAMAGGYFVTGWNSTYYGGAVGAGPFDVDGAVNDPWEDDVQHVPRLFAGLGLLEWWKLQPSDGLLTSGVARGADLPVNNVDGSYVAPPRRTFWALAEIGRQYVAYVRGHDGPHTLSLGGAPSGTWSLRLFDPRTGAVTDLGSVSGAGPFTLDPPSADDWVYVLLRQDGGGPGTGTLDVAPEADTYVSQASPTTNYGRSGQLFVAGGTSVRTTWLRFDVAGLPAGATITDARLLLTCSNGSAPAGGGGTLRRFAPTDPVWSETAPTANAPLAGSESSSILATLGPVAAGSRVEFTGLAGALPGNGRITFVIRSTRGDAAAYRSRQYVTASQRPVLRITYTTP